MNEKLTDFINQYPTMKDAAEALGVHKCTVSCWVRGTRQISLSNALKVQKVSKGKIKWEELRPDLAF